MRALCRIPARTLGITGFAVWRSVWHDRRMGRKLINSICESFPGAEVSDPWGGGHHAWKVGGKVFACVGAVTPGVSVKTDSVETAEMLIEAGVGTKAPYFHRSWILLSFEAAGDELRHRLQQSYQIVRAGLPKKEQAKLEQLPAKPAKNIAKRC
jgi:predicted DNA-binding protein (MmcQ/YjbR family)